MLRVSRGILKGKRLPATDRDLVGVRPFTSRMRKSLFDLLSFEIKGSVFWDIFCGSGIVGIEALSLGAGCVYFVDKNKRLLLLIKRFLNENNLHMMGSFFLKNLDLTKDAFVSSDEPDIVIIDPPYAFKKTTDVLERIAQQCKDDTRIFIHIHKKRVSEFDGLRLAKVVKIRNYGEAALVEARRKL